MPDLGIRLPTLSEWLALLGGPYGDYGYALVLVAAALENTFLVTFFFPGGTMVLLGGIYARQGLLELPYVVLVGWIGTFCGASFDYAVGRWGERTFLRRLLRHRHAEAPLERAAGLLRRYGFLALMVGHFIPQVRSLVAVAAGAAQLSYRRFVLYEAPAALAWASVYGVGGYLLAEQIPLFEEMMRRFGWAVALLVGAFFTWKLYLQPRAARREPARSGEPT